MRRHVPISLTLILSLMFTVPGTTLVVTAGGTLPVQEMARVDQPVAGTTAPVGLTDGEWATLQDLIRQAEYQFAWQVSDGEWAHRAPNRAHDLSLSLAADGFHVARYRKGEMLWEFGLSLAAYGEQAFPTTIAADSLVGSRERVEYHWSRDVVEWYTNSAEGVEHGLTLARPMVAPAGADGASAELTFALRGSLTPELDGDGRTLRLKDNSGQIALHYDRLAVYDATGRSLPAHFTLSPGGEGRGEGEMLHLVIDTAGAAYPLTVDPLIHAHVKKLTAADPDDQETFGYSVAISGDTAVVGAPYEDGWGYPDRGAGYIFVRNRSGADSWSQAKKLLAGDPASEDWFGYSVAISGDTVVVGAPRKDDVGSTGCVTGTNCGAAYIFERNRGGTDNWGVVTRINAFNANGYDSFGWSVAISNDTVVVGAPYADTLVTDGGLAHVFERNQDGSDAWGQVRMLMSLSTADSPQFGHSIGISGDTVVVGAWTEDNAGYTNCGAAYLFVRNEGGADNWGVVAELTASDAADEDLFGSTVAISGDTVVVGARGEDGMRVTDRGAAYVFERNQGGADAWGEVTKLTALEAGNLDYFGDSVAICVDTIVVGAWGEDGAGSDRGAAYVFERNRGGADGWGQATKLAAFDAENGDIFGKAVAISGDTLVVGAPGEDGSGTERGAAYLFGSGGQWLQGANPHASDGGNDDYFGISVAISGDTVVVGANEWEGSSGSNIGAAYVLERNEDGLGGWGEVKRILAADGASWDQFGSSVSISNDTIVVGAPGEASAGEGRGAAYVFERNYDRSNPGVPLADNWGEVKKLTASDAGDLDHFGDSVGISDDTIVVGAPWEEGSVGAKRGAAYLFTRNQGGGDNWGQVKKLLASDEQSYAYFGSSAAIDNDTVVVGAYKEDGGGADRGAAYVFERNQGGGDNWDQVAKLTASDAQDDDYFGCSVSISDDTVVVGAYGENGFGFLPDDRGAAYLFERNQDGIADNWGEVTKLMASDAADFDYFGSAVAISGDQIVVGAPGKNAGGTDRGVAYIFVLQPYKSYLPLASNDN